MRIVEEQQLNTFVEELKAYKAKNGHPLSFYGNIRELPDVSLQSFSFARDMEFFDEVSFILSVIVSIIKHPHISNKREEVIIRVEQAKSLQANEFKQVLQDPKLWKQHGAEMLPEEVHYYQHVDELRIYENCFIVLLVKLLDADLQKYADFYISILPSVGGVTLYKDLDAKEVGAAIRAVDRLRRKIRFIKNTYFFKEVSKGQPISKNIKPTNILLKDRLYRHCFKFYRKFIRYEDEGVLIGDLRDYYYTLILKELQRLEFHVFYRRSNKVSKNPCLSFIRGNFELKLNFEEKTRGILLTSQLRSAPHLTARHLLLFDPNGDGTGATANTKKYDTVSVMSVWNLYLLEEALEKALKNPHTEGQLVDYWIGAAVNTVHGDKEIYSRYCPVCRSKNVDADGDGVRCVCRICRSEYIFYQDEKANGADAIWFVKQRRS